ncbi:hypothetical protein D3C72_2052990 [compost metagenome]
MGSFRALTVAAWMRSTTACGVPAGATSPYQAMLSTSARPPSVKVGTSGRAGRRLGAATARARSLPAWMWGMDEGRLSNWALTWPAITSLSAGPEPR